MSGVLSTALAALLLAGSSGADEDGFDPATLPLTDLIACKSDLPSWNGFGLWFHDNPDAWRRYGVRKLESRNPFLAEYRTDRPIEVFGRMTDRIALTSSGMLAIFAGDDPAALAHVLGIKPVIAGPTKFMGERIVTDSPFDGGSPAFQGRLRISLNVSTVSSHPGAVLAGCSYRLIFNDD